MHCESCCKDDGSIDNQATLMRIAYTYLLRLLRLLKLGVKGVPVTIEIYVKTMVQLMEERILTLDFLIYKRSLLE